MQLFWYTSLLELQLVQLLCFINRELENYEHRKLPQSFVSFWTVESVPLAASPATVRAVGPVHQPSPWSFFTLCGCLPEGRRCWSKDQKIIQVGRDTRRSLFQPPAPSRVSYGIRPECSGLCPAGSRKPPRTASAQPLWAISATPALSSQGKGFSLHPVWISYPVFACWFLLSCCAPLWTA